jgi:hypothetical protein
VRERSVAPPVEYRLVEWTFLRLIGLIYFSAFISFGVQARGLIGSDGILPLAGFIRQAGAYLGAARYWKVPTVFWFGASDATIQAVWIAGAIAAMAVAVGFFTRTALIVCFTLYLSIVSAGQEFMSFQWDLLLLEAGFLSIFIGYSRVVIWLFRWLVFRLMFLSGAVKLLSGDQAWRALTAIGFHYQTQPLPAPLAWYLSQLPMWFHKSEAAFVFAIELIAPFLIFTTRRLRFASAFCLIALQTLIYITGNYAFFNILSMALCIFLFDDHALRRALPPVIAQRAFRSDDVSGRQLMVRRTVASSLTFVLVLLTGSATLLTFFGSLPGAARGLIALASPFGIANSYGLFAVMTTTRPEIIFEGSNDGVNWKAYEFKYKPGDIYRPLPTVAPHQPRLDWQMWFAALGSYRENPWLVNFAARLLQGSAPVLRLLAYNPFAGKPPRFVRSQIYEYRFTDRDTRKRTGAVWQCEVMGTYLRQISLDDLRLPNEPR